VEEKAWESADSITKVVEQIIKCETRIMENADNIHSIQAEQVRPSTVGTEGSMISVVTTDWSVLLDYVTRLHHVLIKRFDGDANAPGSELKAVLEKIYKQLKTCVDFAKTLKDCDDLNSVESKNFTKALEILSWTLYALIKRDREYGELNKVAEWIALDSIPFGDEKTKLKEGMIDLSIFINDALRNRIDTAYLSIQLKELELVAQSLIDSKNKHTQYLTKVIYLC
jgi:hypothetical protein